MARPGAIGLPNSTQNGAGGPFRPFNQSDAPLTETCVGLRPLITFPSPGVYQAFSALDELGVGPALAREP